MPLKTLAIAVPLILIFVVALLAAGHSLRQQKVASESPPLATGSPHEAPAEAVSVTEPAPPAASEAPTFAPVALSVLVDFEKLSAEGDELAAKYRRELLDWRMISPTVKRHTEVVERQAALIAKIARERELDPGCFVGSIRGQQPLLEACQKARKLWGIDPTGKVGLASLAPPR